MTVRAVLERTVKPDRRDELLLLFKELRAHAIHQPGCIAGETLTSVDSSGTHLVVSM
jgi:quinol monooxygenase YgiN